MTTKLTLYDNKYMRKLTAVAAFVIAVTLGTASLAGADPWNGSLTFNDTSSVATFVIPPSQSGPTYKLSMNSVLAGTITATVEGTSGTLTVPYPPGFCGLIQADAYVEQDGHWSPVRGFQHTVTCDATTTTTTMPAPPAPAPTPPTVVPPAPAPVTPTVTPSAPVPAPVVPAPHLVATTSVPSGPQLPMTGAPIVPLLLAGSTAVAFGLLLMRRRHV